MTGYVHVDTHADVSTLSHSQTKALNALMQSTTIEGAAKAAGLGTSTVKKYLTLPEFKRAYRGQRAIMLSETVSGLMQLGAKAIAVIAGALDNDGDPNAQLRAARHTLDYLTKLVELERRVIETDELEGRLSALEAARDARQ